MATPLNTILAAGAGGLVFGPFGAIAAALAVNRAGAARGSAPTQAPTPAQPGTLPSQTIQTKGELTEGQQIERSKWMATMQLAPRLNNRPASMPAGVRLAAMRAPTQGPEWYLPSIQSRVQSDRRGVVATFQAGGFAGLGGLGAGNSLVDCKESEQSWCERTYGAQVNPTLYKKCVQPGVNCPHTDLGKAERGLPSIFDPVADAARKGYRWVGDRWAKTDEPPGPGSESAGFGFDFGSPVVLAGAGVLALLLLRK